MNKKIIGLVVVGLIIIAAGTGIWWWEKYKEPLEKKWNTAKVSPRRDFIIKEILDAKIIENEKLGLSFKMPEGWILKDFSSDVPGIVFYTPDVEVNNETNDLFMKVISKGCRIQVLVKYIKMDIETFESFSKGADLSYKPLSIDKYERIKLNNLESLKHTFEGEGFKMYFIELGIPTKNRLYIMTLLSSLSDKVQCEEEFNKFLETISIR